MITVQDPDNLSDIRASFSDSEPTDVRRVEIADRIADKRRLVVTDTHLVLKDPDRGITALFNLDYATRAELVAALTV